MILKIIMSVKLKIGIEDEAIENETENIILLYQ